MLYGAHGQPLGLVNPQAHPPYYPPPPQSYAPNPSYAHLGPPPPHHGNGAQYEAHTPPSHQGNSVSNRKRPPPVDLHNQDAPTITSGHTPQSANSLNSPRVAPIRDGRTPNQQAVSSANGRNGMHVRDWLSAPPHAIPTEQRGRSDDEMLSKLEGKKK
jgi:hypothetical protein